MVHNPNSPWRKDNARRNVPCSEQAAYYAQRREETLQGKRKTAIAEYRDREATRESINERKRRGY